jgi:general stress protein 26
MENNLQDQAALDKLKSLVEEIRICMYTTVEDGKVDTRPMTTLDVDDSGNIWFFTNRATDLVDTPLPQPVTLIYSNPSKNSYLTISGEASVVNGPQKKEELWNPMARAWFPQGKNDPSLVVVKVATQEGFYWDSSSSKMVLLVSFLRAIITEKVHDTGDHGKIDLQ